VRVIGYLRVSTTEQADSGAGIQAQRAAIEAEAARKDWTVIFVEDAGYSAKCLKRPGIAHALDLLARHEADALVVSKLDRLSRSMLDFAGLMDRSRLEGWSLVALDLGVDTSTPAGEMMANVLATFSHFERRLIGQRTKDALAVKRDQGVQLGRPRQMDESTRALIADLRAGGYSLRGIAAELTERGIPTAQQGRAWYASTVSAVLQAA
jgi:DNA invertase Pin-like site-specific DNA recombinase